MAIGDDFEIQNDKDIRYTGTTTNYTVLELHRWLQDRADDASASGDDYMDITRDTPSDKSFDTIINLINSYNIDDTAAQHLYGGSIIQSDGDVIYDGLQVLAPAGMRLEIVQNGALVGTNFWTTGLNADSANGISHQFMLKVRTGGADIDGRRLLGLTREWGKTFLEFKINGTARGVNVMAFTGWADDLNNTTVVGDLTSSPFTTVSLTTAGYNGIDVNNNGADEYYYFKIKVSANATAAANLLTEVYCLTSSNTTAQAIQYALDTATVSMSGLVTGSRVKASKVSDGTILFNGAESSGEISFETDYIGAIALEARKASSAPYYKPFVTQVTSVAGAETSAVALQVED